MGEGSDEYNIVALFFFADKFSLRGRPPLQSKGQPDLAGVRDLPLKFDW